MCLRNLTELCQAFLDCEGEAHQAGWIWRSLCGTPSTLYQPWCQHMLEPRPGISSGLKPWLSSAKQHERTWSWEGEWDVSGWLGSTAFSAWMLALHRVSYQLM